MLGLRYVFMWLMLFFGTGLLMCLYSHEWYARMVRRVRKREERMRKGRCGKKGER